MAKLKITKEQYNRILIREQEARLKASGDLLTENISTDPELLEEGWKEVVLGVAMMMGVGLSGQNKAMAQDAVKNASTMSQIKATLEDENKVAELSDLLEKKGMKNADEKLANNAEQVMDQFNKIAKNNKIKYHVDTKVVKNLQQLKGKLSQGYALKNAEMSTDTIQGQQAPTPISIIDTMEINLGSDNLFVTGGFTLSSAGKDTIKTAIEEIAKQGGKIQSVEIESSTDAEQIVKFITKDDPTGNIKLSNLRTQSITNELTQLGVNSNITHREIPNNGSDVVSTQEFKKYANNPKAIEQLREKTADFRYVKIKIIATFSNDTIIPQDTPPSFIKHYRFELVKVIESSGKTLKRKSGKVVDFPHKKYKCKKPKGKHAPIKCSFEH
jgi:outer membrane protein OmpA-like peptidoglycan-associated protein